MLFDLDEFDIFSYLKLVTHGETLVYVLVHVKKMGFFPGTSGRERQGPLVTRRETVISR